MAAAVLIASIGLRRPAIGPPVLAGPKAVVGEGGAAAGFESLKGQNSTTGLYFFMQGINVIF